MTAVNTSDGVVPFGGERVEHLQQSFHYHVARAHAHVASLPLDDANEELGVAWTVVTAADTAEQVVLQVGSVGHCAQHFEVVMQLVETHGVLAQAVHYSGHLIGHAALLQRTSPGLDALQCLRGVAQHVCKVAFVVDVGGLGMSLGVCVTGARRAVIAVVIVAFASAVM